MKKWVEMNLTSVKYITVNTIQKEWRNKTIIFLFVVTLLVTLISSSVLSFLKSDVLQDIPMEGVAENAQRLFFRFSNIWSFFIATFVGVSTVSSDVEGQTISQMLSFPISRFEYLMGRALGAYIIITGYYAFTLIMCITSTSLVMGDFIIKPGLLLGALIASLSNSTILLTAIFFGLYYSKIQAFILNIFFTLFLILSNNHFLNYSYSKTLEDLGVFSAIYLVLNSLLPRASLLSDLGNAFILDNKVDFNYGVELPHFVVTMVILFFLNYLCFKRKEL